MSAEIEMRAETRSRAERARLAILKALGDAPAPLGAARLSEALLAAGIELQPRTIRFHLLQLDAAGLTELVSRRQGRRLTPAGAKELAGVNVIEKVGFVAGKMDTLGYQMSFDLQTGQGTVILNRSLIPVADVSRALVAMQAVCAARLGMGAKIMLAAPGTTLCGLTVPPDSAAIGTICSVTVNGILLRERIPVTTRFGGLLEMRDRKPVRFVELIEYSGSTLDPLEIFIRARMTQVQDVVRTGSGLIGASFREVPSAAVPDLRRSETRLRQYGLGGILAIGRPNQTLFNIPVAAGRSGMIVVGGLNPIAALHELGIPVANRSLAGLQDFAGLTPIDELRRRHWRTNQSRPA